MLVLTVKDGDAVQIGEDITIRYSNKLTKDGRKISSGQIRLGIEAPRDYRIKRRKGEKKSSDA